MAAGKSVPLHSQYFVRQIEQGDWPAVGNFLAPDHHGDWGDDRALLLRLRLALRSLLSLTITAVDPQTRLEPPEASWSARVWIAANGSEAAPEITARLNSLTKPFELHWRQESRCPWDWLQQVINPSLEIPGDY